MITIDENVETLLIKNLGLCCHCEAQGYILGKSKVLSDILCILYTTRDKFIDEGYEHEHQESCETCLVIDTLNEIIEQVEKLK